MTAAPTTVRLVHGVGWADRHATLTTAPLEGGGLVGLPLTGRRLSFLTLEPGPFCTGWYDLQGGGDHVACPDQNLAVGSGQCADCGLRDQFRFVHHGHTGGYVPAVVEQLLAAPHWLYLATFADGFTKVGTATEHRRLSRVDEQGPLLATYLGRAADGRVVREAEDLVTAELEVPQHRRRAAKVAALASPAPRAAVLTRHTETVEQVATLLGGHVFGGGFRPVQEPWDPPAEARTLLHPPPRGSWIPYPSDLLTGGHGLQAESAAGAAVLARTRPAPDAPPYLVDLGRLRGARIVLGDFESPEAEVQETLF